MAIKLPEFIVDPENIFAGDELRRKEEVINVGDLLTNLPSPLTLAVNSPWGTGKTAFLKMLQAHLIANNRKALYFSAWETDFAADPLTAFLGEIDEQLSQTFDANDVKSKAWESAKKAGSYLAKKIIPVGVKIATAGVLDLSQEFEEHIVAVTGDISDDAVKSYLKDKEQVTKFKNNISDIVNDSESAIYVFVDELDRCRPDYAILLLERIKHLFNIPGVTFVLAMDKVQLSHSISALYGQNFDASRYLTRFIDLEYKLKRPESAPYVTYVFASLGLNEFFEARQKISNDFQRDQESVVEAICMVATGCHLTLRDIEQFVGRFKLVMYSLPARSNLYPEFVVFLIYLSIYKSEALQPLESSEFRKHLISELEVLKASSHGYDNVAAIIEAHILVLIVGDVFTPAKEQLDHYKAIEAVLGESRERKDYAATVLGFADYLTRRGQRGVPYDIVLSRVALLTNFNFSER